MSDRAVVNTDYSQEVRSQKEPIRLFKSNFLEYFTHITPQAVVIFWLPIIVFFYIRVFAINVPAGLNIWLSFVIIFVGWFAWTFVEYLVHRFIYHYDARTEKVRRLIFTIAGMHHAQPMCKSRLVVPPVISIPLSLFFYGFFTLIFGVILNQPLWIAPAFAGTSTGYLIYDLMHYNLHHGKSKKGFLAMCRRQHMRHHVVCPNMRFGVSMPLWDYVFGTMPKDGFFKTPKKEQASRAQKRNQKVPIQ